MAFHNKPFRAENSIQAGLGIGAFDYQTNSYDANNNVSNSNYYIGGLQGAGTLIATVTYTYDANNNPLTIERTVGPS